MGERHSGGPAKCRVSLKLRDHSLKRYEEKKTLIRAIVDCLRVRYPRAKINLTIEDVYGNIADAIKPENSACIDMLRRAMEIEQVTAKDIAMRGARMVPSFPRRVFRRRITSRAHTISTVPVSSCPCLRG